MKLKLFNFIAYIGIPFIIIAIIYGISTIEPIEPPAKPLNGTFLALLLPPGLLWLVAYLLSIQSNKEKEFDNKEFLYYGSLTLFIVGWVFFIFMYSIILISECYIFPWEPATCRK